MATNGAENSAAVEPVAKLLFGEHTVDSFSQQLFESLVGATKISHRLPPPDDFRYLASFGGFKRRSAAAGTRLLALANRLLQLPGTDAHPMPPLLDADADADTVSQQFDDVVDVIDGFLEKIDSFADEVKGFKAEPKIVIAQARTAANAGRRAGSGGVNVFMATSVVRPQLSFELAVDNSNSAWLPRLADKPHGLMPLPIPMPLPTDVSASSPDGSLQHQHQQQAAHGLSDELQRHMLGSLGMPPAALEPRAEHPYLYEISKLRLEPWMTASPAVAEEPGAIESTPLEWIDTPDALERAAAELENEPAVAVDLEHHSLRSFQGFTCLMQLSSRRKDYLVDTLKLRSHVGRCLRPLFADGSVVKVLHGADSDVVWLQRDFDIYVVNLFDTGQAARVLPLERAGLAHALAHYCGLKVDKQYQLADWRVRPLPPEMLKYAREDTHYLLYVWDRMRQDLIAASSPSSADRDLMGQAVARSRQVALKLYEKERLTPHSHLLLYNKSNLSFNSEQLAALRAAFEWRDGLARLEDESTQFVLPNYQLLRLAADLPRTQAQLLACCRPVPPPLVKRDAADLLDCIVRARAAAASMPAPAAAAAAVQDVAASSADDGERCHLGHQQAEAVGAAFWASRDSAAQHAGPHVTAAALAADDCGWVPAAGVTGRTARVAASNAAGRASHPTAHTLPLADVAGSSSDASARLVASIHASLRQTLVPVAIQHPDPAERSSSAGPTDAVPPPAASSRGAERDDAGQQQSDEDEDGEIAADALPPPLINSSRTQQPAKRPHADDASARKRPRPATAPNISDDSFRPYDYQAAAQQQQQQQRQHQHQQRSAPFSPWGNRGGGQRGRGGRGGGIKR
eukprot:TRINITY_DN619_c0_g1_i1.p1 TRINITY_DN619_c0_g1~~TRINITY_DN619_c0_g1_i1.p1  ORF type:complete len:857 (-),score=388.24 TRINITY_DN619_c0_g1_i1:349-2919(-)